MSSHSLLCLSVQQFLCCANWEEGHQGRGAEGQRGRGGEVLPLHSMPYILDSTPSLKCLTVQEFLHLCQWEGQTEMGNSPAHLLTCSPAHLLTCSPAHLLTCSPALLNQTTWLRLPLKEFFRHCNWQGQPPEGIDWGQLDPYARLRQQVREFFQFMAWEGDPTIGKLPKVAAISSAPPIVDEPTFTDLSELF